MIKHAIVGCGRVAPCHAEAFQWAGNPVYACTDVVRERSQSLAARFGIPVIADSFESLLYQAGIDSVSLCVPHDLHSSMTLMALAAGKHVLVEKPAVLDTKDAEQIVEAMIGSGRTVMPVVQHRFDPLIIEISDLVNKGALGDLRFVRAHLECVRSPDYYATSDWRGRWAREGGSVLMNQGYHLADLLLFLAGPVASVSAQMATFAPAGLMETEDALAATVRFTTGALGSITINGASGSHWNSYIELMGSTGELGFTINYPNTVLRFCLEDKRQFQIWRKRLDAACAVEVLPTAALPYYGTSHRQQARAFLEQLAGIRQSRAASFEHAVETVRTIQLIYGEDRANSPGKTVGLPAIARGHSPASQDRSLWTEKWNDIQPEDAGKVAKLVARGETSIVSGGLLDRFEARFAHFAGVRHAVAFCNGTAALYAALWAVGVRAGDEVVICDYGFHGMAAAVLALGTRLIFCDCLAESLLLNPQDIRAKITSRTKAIVVHNPWGVPAAFDEIREAAGTVPIISDGSHAHGASFHGRPIAAWADITCFSLGRFKLVSGGELGCAVTSDPQLRDRMLVLGHVNRVPHALASVPWRGNAVGLKFRPHPAALCLAMCQLSRVEAKLNLSRNSCSRLELIFNSFGLMPQLSPDNSIRSYWKMVFRMGAGWENISSATLEDLLRTRRIPVEPNHYWPLLQDQEISQWPDYRDQIVRCDTPVAHSIVPRTITVAAPVHLAEESYARTERALREIRAQL